MTTMLALALVFSACFTQNPDATHPTPYDQVHALKLTADDPALIDDHGPTKLVEYTVEFSGKLEAKPKYVVLSTRKGLPVDQQPPHRRRPAHGRAEAQGRDPGRRAPR